MNKMELGKRVFSIHHGEGTAHPKWYMLEYQGVVERLRTAPTKVVDWGKQATYGTSEKTFLEPSKDGFCYFMAELPEMEQYKVESGACEGLYQVPTSILLQHMKSYQSPW